MHEQNVVLGTPQLGVKLCISMQLMSLRRQGKFIALRVIAVVPGLEIMKTRGKL